MRTRNALLAGQKRVLELIAAGAPVDDTLTELMRFIEAQEDGLRCGILIVSEDGAHFRRGSGPNLPEAYHQALDGVPITPPYLGSCAEAAHTGLPVFVADIAADITYSPQWRELVMGCGLHACCSLPVRAADGTVLAAFAIYYSCPRDLHPADPELMEIATHLAGIALERARWETKLREREALLEADLAATRQLQT
ncbi:MAG TPA: GAF domain-containing protein, partial [Gammaproteobacteria bacterium]|nr:GAF domain-containing protein [Gammaproteobacteria bacterium]